MKDAGTTLAAYLADQPVGAPKVPLYSNLTGSLYPENPDAIKDVICQQLQNSVRWESIIRDMASRGVDRFVEVGAGKTLSGLVAKTLSDVTIANVADNTSLAAALSVLA